MDDTYLAQQNQRRSRTHGQTSDGPAEASRQLRAAVQAGPMQPIDEGASVRGSTESRRAESANAQADSARNGLRSAQSARASDAAPPNPFEGPQQKRASTSDELAVRQLQWLPHSSRQYMPHGSVRWREAVHNPDILLHIASELGFEEGSGTPAELANQVGLACELRCLPESQC